MHDKYLPALAIFCPFHIHRAILPSLFGIVLLYPHGIAREREYILIGNRKSFEFFLGGFDIFGGVLAAARGIHHFLVLMP